MTTATSATALPHGQTNNLAVLLDALDGVALYASLTWLAGFEACTVENLATVITRARDTVGENIQLPTTGDLAESGP